MDSDKPACPECGKTDWCDWRTGGPFCFMHRLFADIVRSGEAPRGVTRDEVVAAVRKRLDAAVVNL